MSWYYVLNGTSHGPIEVSELLRLQRGNAIPYDTPVWTAGLAEWVPFSRSPLATGLPPAGYAPGTRLCAECGQPFPEGEMLQYENSWVCAACKPIFFQRLKEGAVPLGVLRYASVGQRFLALIIDAFVTLGGVVICLTPFFLTATWIVGADHQTLANRTWFVLLMVIAEYAFPIAYEIYFIGRYGATLGKMALNIKVVSAGGGRVSYGRATGRLFAKGLSAMICYLGFILPFFDDQKRALHDYICTTRVIVNEAAKS